MSEDVSAEPRSEPARRRQAELLVLVRRAGRLDVGPTAARLGVTQETIRRDLRTMERRGLVRRSYGAAFPVESGRFETRFEARKSINAEEKVRIAEASAALVDTAQTIYIDEGYLPTLIVEELSSIRPLTVITPSLPAAIAAARRPGLEVIIVGGRVREATLSSVELGPDPMLSQLNIDIAFVSAAGISADSGLTTSDPTVAAVKTAAIRASRRRVFVGTHTKFGVTGFVRFAGVHAFEALVTGIEFPGHRAARYTQLGPRLIRA